MLVAARNAWQVRQFRDPVDQDRDRLAEIAPDIVQSDRCILDCIVEQSRGHNLRRDTQICKDAGNRQAVIDVWLTRVAFLFAVGFLRHTVGALNQFSVSESVIVGELFQQPLEWNGCFGGFHSDTVFI
jgi:hypothetical protein